MLREVAGTTGKNQRLGPAASACASASDRPLLGLMGGGAKLPRRARARLQRHQALRMAHGAGDAVDHRHGKAAAQSAREAGQRRTGQDDHVGAVFIDGAFAQGLQPRAVILLHARLCRPAAGRARGCWPGGLPRPLACTTSRYQAWMRCEIATMEKRWPSRQALASADSVRPEHRHRKAVRGCRPGPGRRTRQRSPHRGPARVRRRASAAA